MNKIKDSSKPVWKAKNKLMNDANAENFIRENPGQTIFSKPIKIWQLRQGDL